MQAKIDTCVRVLETLSSRDDEMSDLENEPFKLAKAVTNNDDRNTLSTHMLIEANRSSSY